MMGSQEGIALREQRRWKELFAAAGRDAPPVLLIDADLICSPTPETFIEGLSLLVGLIHPELAGRDLLSPRR
jgi:iron complex transport system substrate-binding protein